MYVRSRGSRALSGANSFSVLHQPASLPACLSLFWSNQHALVYFSLILFFQCCIWPCRTPPHQCNCKSACSFSRRSSAVARGWGKSGQQGPRPPDGPASPSSVSIGHHKLSSRRSEQVSQATCMHTPRMPPASPSPVAGLACPPPATHVFALTRGRCEGRGQAQRSLDCQSDQCQLWGI